MSVVIPTRNRSRQLTRAVASVRAQSVTDLEVLVVDDGSSPPAGETLAAQIDARIRIVRHAERRGGSAARNTGIAHARGAYVALLDDDDEWLPRKLELQLERFEAGGEEIGLVYCGVEVVSERTATVEWRYLPQGPPVVFADFLRSTFFGASAAVVRRACFAAVGGFDEALAGTQDRDMWLRLARHCRLDYVPETLVRWYIHQEQITSNLAAKIDARRRLLRKYRDDLARHPAILAKQLVSLGMMYGADARPVPAAWCFLRAIRHRPRHPVAYRHLARLLSPHSDYRSWVHETGFRRVDGVSLYF